MVPFSFVIFYEQSDLQIGVLAVSAYNLFMCICPSPITNYASVYKFMPPFSFSIEIC